MNYFFVLEVKVFAIEILKSEDKSKLNTFSMTLMNNRIKKKKMNKIFQNKKSKISTSVIFFFISVMLLMLNILGSMHVGI